jgi:Tfp pilus tip-associated adhesin PilY1
MNNFSLEIANLWEKEPHVYLLVCNSNKESKNEEKNTNNNYILDVRKEIIRETKFNFGEWSNRLMDYFNLGEVSAFHTFSYINGEAQSSPVFYVNN